MGRGRERLDNRSQKSCTGGVSSRVLQSSKVAKEIIKVKGIGYANSLVLIIMHYKPVLNYHTVPLCIIVLSNRFWEKK